MKLKPTPLQFIVRERNSFSLTLLSGMNALVYRAAAILISSIP
jgi:hypothetical protein